MKNSFNTKRLKIARIALFSLLCAALVFAAILTQTRNASANHPVLVEGERDFDGDGLVGLAEDTDNDTDRVFGTINAALGAANGGANQNGRVTIVTSGRFGEIVNITAANGNVTLEAAPGVEANLDAVIAGARGSQFPTTTNATRQNAPGIIVDAPADRYVSITNIVSRNWTSGIQVNGNSRVAVTNCRIENNINYGIEVTGNARVKVDQTTIHATGFRTGMTGDFPRANQPNPGKGIEFDDNSRGAVFRTEVSGSFDTGISNETRDRRNVFVRDVYLFDNRRDLVNVTEDNGGKGRFDRSFGDGRND